VLIGTIIRFDRPVHDPAEQGAGVPLGRSWPPAQGIAHPLLHCDQRPFRRIAGMPARLGKCPHSIPEGRGIRRSGRRCRPQSGRKSLGGQRRGGPDRRRGPGGTRGRVRQVVLVSMSVRWAHGEPSPQTVRRPDEHGGPDTSGTAVASRLCVPGFRRVCRCRGLPHPPGPAVETKMAGPRAAPMHHRRQPRRSARDKYSAPISLRPVVHAGATRGWRGAGCAAMLRP
jgi:hypothetical protein